MRCLTFIGLYLGGNLWFLWEVFSSQSDEFALRNI